MKVTDLKQLQVIADAIVDAGDEISRNSIANVTCDITGWNLAEGLANLAINQGRLAEAMERIANQLEKK